MITRKQLNAYWDKLRHVLSKPDDDFEYWQCIELLVDLSPIWSTEQRAELTTLTISAILNSKDATIVNHGAPLKLLAFLDPTNRDSFIGRLAMTLNDLSSMGMLTWGEARVWPTDSYSSIVSFTSRKRLCELLSHPGNVGELRDYQLARFEELVFHEGKRVFLKPPTESKSQLDNSLQQKSEPPRRFHDVHDAAARGLLQRQRQVSRDRARAHDAPTELFFHLRLSHLSLLSYR